PSPVPPNHAETSPSFVSTMVEACALGNGAVSYTNSDVINPEVNAAGAAPFSCAAGCCTAAMPSPEYTPASTARLVVRPRRTLFDFVIRTAFYPRSGRGSLRSPVGAVQRRSQQRRDVVHQMRKAVGNH